jgi:hypothetical protein
MLSRLLPQRIERSRKEPDSRTCPAHRAWVRSHHCCVPGCRQVPIECAHVRSGTDGGIGLKPSDRWTISLCVSHHAEQHRVGEAGFQRLYGMDLRELAALFAKQSPHRLRLI